MNTSLIFRAQDPYYTCYTFLYVFMFEYRFIRAWFLESELKSALGMGVEGQHQVGVRVRDRNRRRGSAIGWG